MKRREFLRKSAALTGAPLLAAGRAGAAAGPNILFIMSDDHAAHAIGAYGGRLAALKPTPVLDGLAQEGAVFENCFVTNSICVPSRACIMTGQYNHVNGAHTLGGRLAPEQQYLAIEMRKAGYQTAMMGKWHLKEEPNFDHYKVLPGQGRYNDPTFRDKTGGAWPRNTVQMTGHSSDCITDNTLEWLGRRDRERSFFLMHHYKAPHDYFTNAERYESYLADVEVPEPASMWEQPNFGSMATRGHNDECVPYIGTSIGRRNPRRNYTKKWANDETLTDEQAKRQAYQTYLKEYLRCVKGIDDNLRRLFDYLKAEGLYDNTVIIYTSDQGMMLGEHDYQDKRWMYEESMRMPLLIRYPRSVEAGMRTDAIVENVDLGPTMLDFAGVRAPKYMQGRSFRRICETGREPGRWKKAAYYRYWMHMAHHDNPAHFGIRTKQHKLIFYYGCGMDGGNRTPPGWELYDLAEDPREVNNVYDDPAYSDVVRRMKRELRERRRQIGDTDAEFPEMQQVINEFWDYDDEARAKAEAISHDYAERAGRPRRRGGSSGRSQKAEVLPGGWIKAAASKATLKTHAGLREISRDAVYKVSRPGPPQFNVDNAYLLSGDSPPVKPHAFHSPENAEQPWIVVRLEKASRVRYVRIVNRKGSHQERAEGLTVWVSDDEKAWKQLWQAPKVAAEWLADVGDSTTCRYIKIGLPRRGTLHLNQVTVFGE
ncbi:MAG: sulfatase-like hydrolase/transferase [Candidatus Brocadiaceae bacterium]